MKPTDILFKAKTLNGEWIEGCYTRAIIDRETYQELCHFIVTEENGTYEIDPSTLCQWTTLTDENGKKIFSGDVVSVEFFGSKSKTKEVIVFEEGSFMLERKCIAILYTTSIEVIWNIHDNKKLIK